MDFFTRQEAARRRTGWLVFLFFAALAGIIATSYLAVTVILQTAFQQDTSSYSHQQTVIQQPQFDPELLLGVAAVISLVVLGSSAVKLSQLKKGGDKIAESLGGKRLLPGSQQFHERRLLNVVEEMALASGVPVPPVYVMIGQKGINAFAAGYSIHDAVIGVTEGTMKGLKRAELQGVIAHEFSHILNGDMRMNIRLMGVLHGLLVLAIIGRILVRISSSGRRVSSSKKGGGVALIIFLGLALMIIGYFGYFFGGLIKRAVSRQREYLADASAVQFTRDTDGLSGALKKIGGLAMGGRIIHDHAEELSHMFFADGIKRMFGAGSMFSTHPPLSKRIKVLDPSFNGEFPLISEDALYISGKDEEPAKEDATKKKTSALPNILNQDVLLGGVLAGGGAGAIIQQVGVLDAVGQDAANSVMKELPAELCEAVRDPVGAQSYVLAMLIGRAEEDSADAWTWVPAAFIDSVGQLMALVGDVDRNKQLMLLEMSLPALRSLGKDQATRFVQIMQQVIDADEKLEMYEFAVGEIVQSSLRQSLEIPLPKVRITKPDAVKSEISLLLGMMAQAGDNDINQVRKAFDAGAATFGTDGQRLEFNEKEAFNLTNVKAAMAKMLETTMPVRKAVLEAAITCVMADQKAKADELELFRAFASAMEVPVPMGLLAKLSAAPQSSTDTNTSKE